jgi:hypothetical protein
MIAVDDRQTRGAAPGALARTLAWQAIELLRNLKRQYIRLTWRTPQPQKPTIKNFD